MEGERTSEGRFENGIQVISHVTNKTRVLPPLCFCSSRVWRHQREHQFAVVYPQLVIQVEVQPMIQKNNFEVMRGL